MSLNRSQLATRFLLSLCLSASLAACATDGDEKPAKSQAALPTEHYAIKVTASDDQIMLAPHASGLSPAQSSALQDLVNRWRDAGGGVIKSQTPAHGGEDAYRATALIQAALYSPRACRPTSSNWSIMTPAARMHAPIIVGFNRYVAEGPDCGRNWKSFTRTMSNDAQQQFRLRQHRQHRRHDRQSG